MKTRRSAAAIGLAILLLSIILAMPSRGVQAQGPCDPATGADCDSGEKEKKPTVTDVPTATATPALVPMSGGGSPPAPVATAAATIDPSAYATARACWDDLYRKTPQPELPTPSWGDIQFDAPQCIPGSAPDISIPRVAGPVFVPPGVRNVIIAVLLLAALLTGVLIGRTRFRPPNPNKPPSPNVPSPPPIRPGEAVGIQPGPPQTGVDVNRPPGPPT